MLVMTPFDYNPDPAIDAGLRRKANEAEAFDLSIGYPPRLWTCPCCSAAHSRGHFGSIGVHRCLRCGYSGDRGVLSLPDGGP